MPRGGARVNSGPAPDPNALRRDRKSDAAGWTVLPAEGRTAPAPKWPLSDPYRSEEELWASLWRKPQAVMWERLSQEYEVALCVRALLRTEGHGEEPPKAADYTVARQFMDSLGLSVNGMLRNRWKVADASDQPDSVVAAETPAPRRQSARDRLKLVADER